jgi:hypothetical protein
MTSLTADPGSLCGRSARCGTGVSGVVEASKAPEGYRGHQGRPFGASPVRHRAALMSIGCCVVLDRQ